MLEFTGPNQILEFYWFKSNSWIYYISIK
jgi:hypothetical protein